MTKAAHNILLLLLIVYSSSLSQTQSWLLPQTIKDTAFWQEYHEPYPVGKQAAANEVRSIAADDDNNIWIATADGIFVKHAKDKTWLPVLPDSTNGPSYAVTKDSKGNIWCGTWNGVYIIQGTKLLKAEGTEGPVAVLCAAKEGVYALGPKGIWLWQNSHFVKQSYPVARSVRHAVSDNAGGLWVATDVGLYHCTPSLTQYFQKTNELVSAYIKGVAIKNDKTVWAGGTGGVSILQNGKKVKFLRPEDGIPSINVNCIEASPEGVMWIGTDVGIVRYGTGGEHSLRFSRRWLLDDKVNDICFDAAGTAWIATAKGVSAIKKKRMTLAQKADFFYDVTMKRHVREPWIVGQCRLPDPEDLTRWEPEDDDNDGEYGGNYLAMESFRYAVTKDKDAKEKAKRSFEFLKMLREITGLDGFFARTIVPVSWGNNVHDPNKRYTEKEIADELVKEPRFKPVEVRWHLSKDGKWLWKGDTSSDEWCGHMMGYFFYYLLVADDAEKKIVADHVSKLADHLMTHDFNMVDIDGTPTRWSVWSPGSLNHDPEWTPDRFQNSMELLTFMKLAYFMTGDQKYQEQYLHLIKEEHYLENMSHIADQNPAWFIYFDVILQMYLYPILLRCETDPALLTFYADHMDRWMEQHKADKSPIINFFYCFARNKKAGLAASAEFLKDTPLDLVNWGIDHRKRGDISIVHTPVLNEVQVSELPPAGIRATVRWDNNPWKAVNAQTNTEREPVFWLLPYWMGRYLGMIEGEGGGSKG